MSSGWRRLVLSSLLLLALMVAVAAVLGLVGGIVMLPQLGALGWVAVGLGLFLALQLVLFRLLGLRSRADDDAESRDEPPAGDQPADDSGDWRAWRG